MILCISRSSLRDEITCLSNMVVTYCQKITPSKGLVHVTRRKKMINENEVFTKTSNYLRYISKTFARYSTLFSSGLFPEHKNFPRLPFLQSYI